MSIATDSSLKRFRRVIGFEIVALIVISLITVAPLRFGFSFFGLRPEVVVHLYYGASVALICMAQARYLHPIKSFKVSNWKAYGGGIVVMIGLLVTWLARSGGRTLDFSNLEHGAIFSPIVLAIGLPVIQGITHLIATNSIVNMSGPEARLEFASAASPREWLLEAAEQQSAKKAKLSPAIAWAIGIAVSVGLNFVPFILAVALVARAPAAANKLAVIAPTLLIFGILGYLVARSLKNALSR